MKKIFPIVLLVLIIFISFSVASYHGDEEGRGEEEEKELYIFPHQTNQCPKNINSTNGLLINTLLICNGGAFKKNITITFVNKSKNSTILTSTYIGCDFHNENSTCEITGLASGQCIEIENDIVYQCTQANCSIKLNQEISSTKDEMLSRAYEEYSKKTKCQNLKLPPRGGLQGAPVPLIEEIMTITVASYVNQYNDRESINNIRCEFASGVTPIDPAAQSTYEFFFYDFPEADSIGSITRFTFKFAIKAYGNVVSGGSYSNFNTFRLSVDPNTILYFLGTPIEASNINISLIQENVNILDQDRGIPNSLLVGSNLPNGLSADMNYEGNTLQFTLSFEYNSNLFMDTVFTNNLFQIKPQICLLLTQFNQAVKKNYASGGVDAIDGKYCVQKSSGCILATVPAHENFMRITVPSYVNRVQEHATEDDIRCEYSNFGTNIHRSDAQSEYDFFFYDSVQMNIIGAFERFTYKLAIRAHGNTLSSEWTKNFNTFQLFSDPQNLLFFTGIPVQTSNINFTLLNQNVLPSDIDQIPNSLLVGGTMSDFMNYENNFLNFTLSFDFDPITNVFYRLKPQVCLVVTQFNQAVQFDRNYVNAIPQLTPQYCTQKKIGCIFTPPTEIPQPT